MRKEKTKPIDLTHPWKNPIYNDHNHQEQIIKISNLEEHKTKEISKQQKENQFQKIQNDTNTKNPEKTARIPEPEISA